MDSKISEEEVIAKLKDDGDFDRLRLKIIRKLKENGDLRNSIISKVKQSAALNRTGAENLKPRQLSDAIHEEIGNNVMGQISDAVWEVIRSSDDNGMKSEITETVQSVYDKLLNPKGEEVDDIPVPNDPQSVDKGAVHSDSHAIPCEKDNIPSDSDEPPGFSLRDHQHASSSQEEHNVEPQSLIPLERRSEEEQREESHYPQDMLEPNDSDPNIPPGFAPIVNSDKPCDGSDEDPDVPPGFG